MNDQQANKQEYNHKQWPPPKGQMPPQFAEHHWKPGQSGNPSGRPKGAVGNKLLKKLLEKDEKQLGRICDGIIKAAVKGAPAAFTAIRDTVDGPPKQETHQTVEFIMGHRERESSRGALSSIAAYDSEAQQPLLAELVEEEESAE
jgi:hypothetical protein